MIAIATRFETSEQEPHRLEARKTAELAGIAQRRGQRTDRARDNVPIAGAAGATEHRTGVHAGAAADTGSTASELPGFHATVHAVREGIWLFTGI